MLGACIPVRPVAAGDCAVLESRSGLGALSGRRIKSVEVQSERPHLPGPASAFERLHVASREGVIRRQLLFAVGDTIDSLRVGETLRRLRAQRLFSDAVVLAQHCTPGDGVALTMRTRDTWTLRPAVRLRANNQLSFGVENRNFLGTGRVVALTREMNLLGTGAAFTYTDPFLFGQSVAANLRVANLAGGRTLRLGARRHEYSVLDPWRAEANFARISFRDTAAAEKGLHTISAMVLVGRRIASSPTSITMLLAGAEFDSAASISPSVRGVASGVPHARSFAGVDVGLQHRTAHFDSVSWIVPRRGFLDVPLGWEGEGVIAGGYEREAGSPTMKFDAWAGRVFLPRRGRILMVDGWASSYVGRGVDRNQILRTSVSAYAEAPAGMWGLRLTAERLHEVDPDRRGLSLMPLADYTARAVRPYGARGGGSLAGSLDRDVRVAHVGAASVLNLGAFVAGSYRWRVTDVPGGELGAGVVGARIRVLSAHGTVGSVRMDVGYPVVRSAFVPQKAFFTLTYGTLFDASRQRDGRRIY